MGLHEGTVSSSSSSSLLLIGMAIGVEKGMNELSSMLSDGAVWIRSAGDPLSSAALSNLESEDGHEIPVKRGRGRPKKMSPTVGCSEAPKPTPMTFRSRQHTPACRVFSSATFCRSLV